MDLESAHPFISLGLRQWAYALSRNICVPVLLGPDSHNVGMHTPYLMEMIDNVTFGTLAVDLDHHEADSLDLSSSVLCAHGMALHRSVSFVYYLQLSLPMYTQDNCDMFDTSSNGLGMLEDLALPGWGSGGHGRRG